MPHPAVVPLVLALFLLATGCGGSSTEAVEEPLGRLARSALAGTRRRRRDRSWNCRLRAGLRAVLVPRRRWTGTGRDPAEARVWLARGLDRKPFLETTATSEPIGIEGSDEADAGAIFVTRLEIPEPGKYWILAEPIGGRKIQALGNVVVAERSKAPSIGDRAIASETPTLASTGGDLDALSTQKPPDRELLRVSVADALREKAPFVVAFATPQFCTTRTCGPVVDVVGAVRKKFAKTKIRFIHVEIFEDNDPTKGTNRWVKEWKLPSEPFTFLVGADGLVKERFEGTFSVRELTAAVERELRR